MFVGQTCVDHGGSGSGVANCCAGLTPWGFDSKTGVSYGANNYMCWTATCIPEGQWSGPGGVDSGKCCSGLVASGGKCVKAPIYIPPAPSDELISGIPNTYLYLGAGALVLFLFMSKKKGAK